MHILYCIITCNQTWLIQTMLPAYCPIYNEIFSGKCVCIYLLRLAFLIDSYYLFKKTDIFWKKQMWYKDFNLNNLKLESAITVVYTSWMRIEMYIHNLIKTKLTQMDMFDDFHNFGSIKLEGGNKQKNIYCLFKISIRKVDWCIDFLSITFC